MCRVHFLRSCLQAFGSLLFPASGLQQLQFTTSRLGIMGESSPGAWRGRWKTIYSGSSGIQIEASLRIVIKLLLLIGAMSFFKVQKSESLILSLQSAPTQHPLKRVAKLCSELKGDFIKAGWCLMLTHCGSKITLLMRQLKIASDFYSHITLLAQIVYRSKVLFMWAVIKPGISRPIINLN